MACIAMRTGAFVVNADALGSLNQRRSSELAATRYDQVVGKNATGEGTGRVEHEMTYSTANTWAFCVNFGAL